MTRPLLALALGLLVALPASAQIDASVIPDDAPEWLSMADAIAQAQATGKLLLIHNYARWCGYCRKQDLETYTDDAVQAYMAENYTATRVDVEGEDVVPFFDESLKMKTLASAFGVRGTPTIVFVSPEGELITSIPSYQDAATFLLALTYIREEIYRTMPFPDYVEAQRTAGE